MIIFTVIAIQKVTDMLKSNHYFLSLYAKLMTVLKYNSGIIITPPTTGISNVPSSTCLDLKLHTFKVRKKSSLPEVKFQTLPEPLLKKNI